MGTVKKLIVEVIDAQNLAPKDGHGTSSPYIVIDFYGQRRKTRTAVRDLNPVWNETLWFNVGEHNEIFGDVLELDVYHDMKYGPTRRENSLGRVRLSSTQFVKKGEEALIYYELKKKSLFNMVQGKIGLKIYYVDEEIAPVPEKVPENSAPPLEKTEEAKIKEAEETKSTTEPEKVEPPPAPPSEPPLEGEKPREIPPEKEKTETTPLPEPEPDPKIEPESEPVQEGVEDLVDALPPEAFEMAAASISRSNSEIRFSGINGPHPQPIRRSASTASFTSEASFDSMLIERSTFDLVEKMHYLFVRVVKARYLPTNGSPIVKISVSGHNVNSKPARKTTLFEWNQTFAFARDAQDSSPILEIIVWDSPEPRLLGGVCFDVNEIPVRDPPDSPLAPQWYRMEGGGAQHGDLMIATWIGTQADESFSDAWKSDTYNHMNSKAKVYQSPKLWYLRVTILEAQDITPLMPLKESWFQFQLRVQFGFQVFKTKMAVTKNGVVSWNEDLLFVASEPINVSDYIVFNLENRQPKAPVTMGIVKIPLATVERRVDDRNVGSRWFTFENPKEEKNNGYKGRVHLRLCFDGGYHVMDEAAHVTSDYRPTARQLWKPPVGTIELGIIGCKNLIPMKTVNGKSSTDGYCVAKYGNKWVRTRTVSDNLEPKWNEQYTWKVFDPSTVLTIGVFDSFSNFELDNSNTEITNESTRPDFRIGKVRIRISTLQTGRVYKNTYPLLVLTHGGLKKMGEIELAIRFVRTVQRLDFLHVYSQPMLPLMHHIKPLGVVHQEVLRNTAVKMVAGHLSRSEPPLRKDVVFYMLDADSHNFSVRKVRANWYRIINVVAGLIEIVRWIEDTRGWKNPTATLLVHALLVMLVWFPDLIVPTLAFYVFAIGAWNYRFRARDPLPHFDPKISLADVVDREELDEEFDTVPSSQSYETVRARYDKLRTLGARVQTVLGDLATQGERMQALVTWRDPHATGIFVILCLIVALILYLVPSKMVAMACGFYYLRHPIFRDRLPSPGLNFFRRLPSLSDRIM
ncbi:5-methyltetrahydropteroyltriglutamate--homocysteine S-methyltransferase [Trifolium repens]|nr:5-methyltetrahydropteroyltriglutamate--homocysteine S-methyltransferase [Trifolium repens]